MLCQIAKHVQQLVCVHYAMMVIIRILMEFVNYAVTLAKLVMLQIKINVLLAILALIVFLQVQIETTVRHQMEHLSVHVLVIFMIKILILYAWLVLHNVISVLWYLVMLDVQLVLLTQLFIEITLQQQIVLVHKPLFNKGLVPCVVEQNAKHVLI